MVEVHVYRRGVQEFYVRRGWPHGDAWNAMLNPDGPPTHDTERHAAMLRRKEGAATLDKGKKK